MQYAKEYRLYRHHFLGVGILVDDDQGRLLGCHSQVRPDVEAVHVSKDCDTFTTALQYFQYF